MQWITTDIPIGYNIRRLRKQKGMTQAIVAAKLQLEGSNISRSTLSNIETCRRNIKASDLVLLKELFRVDYDELFKNPPPSA